MLIALTHGVAGFGWFERDFGLVDRIRQAILVKNSPAIGKCSAG
jgi:hypothetical protein